MATLARALGDPAWLFALSWGGWALSWVLAARWSSRPVARPGRWAVRACHGATTLGAVLIVARTSRWLGVPALYHVGRGAACGLALLTLPGFAFAWWARVHLGALWSAGVTLKAGHGVVDTGPYRLVRHPIYTGLLEAALVSALASATALSAFGFALFWLGLWLKARMEERLLSGELGAEAYGAYRLRVPMFLPTRPLTSGA